MVTLLPIVNSNFKDFFVGFFLARYSICSLGFSNMVPGHPGMAYWHGRRVTSDLHVLIIKVQKFRMITS